MLSIAKFAGNYVAFMGAKDWSELLFVEHFDGDSLVCATEDETPDCYHGFVTGAFDHYAEGKDSGIDYVVTCGPVDMMKEVVRIANEKGFNDKDIYVVLEPYMKCGVGICGACSLDDGSVSCTDGHIITADRFKMFVEKHRVKRDATGGWE
jgi:dihydroorotate dehydrogenase electron transfer subunit